MVESVSITYALYERKRVHWVHPFNMKGINERQLFQVTFFTLYQYPEECFKYFRMSITLFYTLVS